MGRTLYYGIDGNIKLTKEQKEKIFALTNRFQKEYEWQYEKVWFPSLYSFPKMSAERKKDIQYKSGSGESIAKNIKKGFTGTGLFEVTEIRIEDEEALELVDKDKLYGFTKVYGNEIDAHNVIKFVTDSSKILSGYEFYFFDDGDAIYCPLRVKNGLAKPDIKHVKSLHESWKGKSSFYEGGLWDLTSKIEFYSKLIRVNFDWSDIIRFVRPLKKQYIKKIQSKSKTQQETSIEDLPSAALDLLLDERLEMMRYYEDLNSFPEEI